MEKEYSSLRDEIMKWQDRRITFSQISFTLVTAFIGYMISNNGMTNILSWQITSMLPILILATTMHVTRLFELFHLRAAAYLAVFHASPWEKNVATISFSNEIWKIGYNKTMAIVYLVFGITSTFIMYQKYPQPFFCAQTIAFGICALLFLSVFVMLFRFNTSDEKERLIKKWLNVKETL